MILGTAANYNGIPIPLWMAWLILASVVIAALGLIWRKAFRPLVRGVTDLVDLAQAAKRDLAPDDGPSLRQSVDGLNTTVQEVVASGKAQAQVGRELTEGLHDLGLRLETLDSYTHMRMHELANKLTSELGARETMERLVDRVVEAASEVKGLRQELAQRPPDKPPKQGA